ncbi:DUF1700 domain-containing protein [Massilia jejuensis]|uniref:DUF1700 domain-containing protein n=1 Tax=Massilia jejuensis TaxID=648894 RepID=A0ABW0PJQ9_9BURK
MGKLDYLDALKRAMPGLAPAVQAKTLAWYEQRFVDGIAAGRSEEDIARELDDPRKVALTLRASTHMDAFAAQRNPASLVRMFVSVLGLLIFNLFMVIPAAVFGALLALLYVAAFAFYVGGIAVAAGGLAGANELVLDGPLRHVVGGAADGRRTRVAIGESGIEVSQDKDADAQAQARREAGPASGSRVVRGAERVAGSGIRISTGVDEASRATQTMLGLASVLGGIVLLLVSIVVTRYAALGVKRYLQMNMSLLRGG